MEFFVKVNYRLLPIYFLCLITLLVSFLTDKAFGSNISLTPLKVGIYDNPPKLFIDKDKQAKGIFPGLIKAIAQKEGWKIQFIPLSFKEGLNRLETGQIDIMQDVAWSKTRSLKYDFTNETVMVSWGRVYKKKGLSDINTLIDLKGKRIAYMDGGIYSEGPDGLKALMKKFEVDAFFLPVNGYKEVFHKIDSGKADAGVVNRLFGKKNLTNFDIENTPILISPISIRFALSKKNKNTVALIEKLDSHLIRLKKDPNSKYYQLIDEYIREPITMVPRFVKNLFYILLIVISFLTILWLMSSWQVRKKTALLQKRDITIKASEKKFQTIFENLQDAYFDTSIQGIFKNVSPSAEALFGYPVSELINESVDKIYYNINDRKHLIETLLNDKKVRDYEILFRRKNNELYWGSINSDLYHDANGTPIGVTGVIRDITHRKNAEKELLEREERFREMARLLPCGIVEMDKDLNFLYANQTGLDMFGYTQLDLEKGLNGKTVIHPDDLDVAQQWFSNHQRNKQSPVECKMIRKNGVAISVLWNSNPIRHNDEIIGYRGSLTDITESKRMQKKIIRTQKLESTGILAGGIAHDFNNILLGLYGNIALAKGELSPKDKAFSILLEAERSMARAKDLTTQLLTFAQGGDPVKKAVTIEQIIRETATFNLSGSNIRVIMEKPDDLWQVHADKGQISQVISNLVINARQAMPEGGNLKISLENAVLSENEFSTLELDKHVKITLTDEGTGISDKFLDKIFDPYFTTKQDGSGLGLAIVHSIILKHNGSIYVNSKIGKSTTFVIYLPAIEKVESITKPIEHHASSGLTHSTIRILLMDDDHLVRDVTKRMLNKLGHSVDLSIDGAEVLKIYKNNMKNDTPFDLVIMDLTIPGGMGGKEAMKKLLKIDPKAKVIVASGYSTDPVLANYRSHGFKAIAKKPFNVENMKQIIDKALRP